MITLFIVLILIFITIAIWQMIKIFDLSRALSGIKIDDSQIASDKDNTTQAKLMLAFLAFIYAITIFSLVSYGKFPLISNAASEHGQKIDSLMIWTLVLIFIVQIISYVWKGESTWQGDTNYREQGITVNTDIVG